MKKINWQNVCFVKTAVNPLGFPKHAVSGRLLPEMAVIGRSNVGKSSLLNHLFQSKKMVKTSSVPGKTQAINFFNVDDALFCADLPGYGFAKVPKTLKEEWGSLIQHYLEQRSCLKILLFLFDIRREVQEEDKNLLYWLKKQPFSLVVVFTKVDKLLKSEKKGKAEALLKQMDIGAVPHVCYSATKNEGRKELILTLEKLSV